MEEKLLKVIERHQILMLAVNKQMGIREAATCVGLSLCYIKRLVKKLRKAQGDFRTLLFQRQHPAWNKFPRDIKNAIVMFKEERPTRSNPFITELMNELHSIKIHPTIMRNILIEAGKYSRPREREDAQQFSLKLKPLVR